MKKVAPKSSTCSAQSSAQSSAQKKIKHKINKENLSLFEKEQYLSENQYMQEKKEDNMLFEEYLENFRGEIK